MFRGMSTIRARRTAALLSFAALAAGAVPALAATKNGIKPVSPKAGATVPAGSRPTFTGRVTGQGVIYVYVSKSPKRNKEGLIGKKEMIQKAKRTGKTFTTRARFFDYPEFWLNSPGTYYWQAHRINCGEGNDCNQEGPVVRFKVG